MGGQTNTHSELTMPPIKVRKKHDGQTDGRTPDRYIMLTLAVTSLANSSTLSLDT